MKKLITIVTLSRDPLDRAVPFNCKYLNYNSFFNTPEGMYESCINSIKLVDTTYVSFVDSDDKMPEYFPLPKKDLLYGDFNVNNNGVLETRVGTEWRDDPTLKNMFMPHKAIFKKSSILKTIEAIDKVGRDRKLIFELVNFYMLGLVFGAEYNKDFIAIWNRKNTGIHQEAKVGTSLTLNWIRENRFKVKDLIETNKTK